MDPRQQQQLKRYLDIILRWKKTIAACLLLSLAGGLVALAITPKMYQATALLIYQRQKINPAKMSPDVISKTEAIVATLQEQVLSRTNLESIIKNYGLYKKELKERPLEDIIDIMRAKHIKIEVDKKGDTFTVSFEGPSPRTVMRVTNELAAKFVEENLRYRSERATETTSYIKDELAMAKKSLQEKEAAMRDYKLKYYNEMPEQRQTNISRLNALQASYQDIQNSLQELERTKIMVQEQITLRKNLLRQDLLADMPPAEDETSRTYAQTRREIERLQAELASLLARYTEAHPEVKRTRKTIASLEAKLKALGGNGGGPEDDGGSPPASPQDSQLVQLQLQLKNIDMSMAQLKKEAAAIRNQIKTYQKWIAAAPVREAEWAALTRDYEQLNKYYQELVSKSLEAESVKNIEQRQKGSQFRIVDPARLPEKPFKPNWLKIMAMATLLGLGLGGGIAFTLEGLDTSFKDAYDLETYLELPIICSVPLITTAAEQRQAKIRSAAWLLAFCAGVVGLAGAAFLLWKKGILVL